MESGISVARMHPFVDEKSILIQHGAFIDVLSVRRRAKFSFSIVLAIVCFSAVAVYMALHNQ